ncbi:uncharacterized protein LOC131165380 isoform X1 [Malania oleifera]|uniref:uncharacterized protein LOC131165380 isoform X1 n=1 Tax=Malania oleifera TaxID=397392 RepID=UPI0025AE729C|nr:uncharacterized protein LOC131165380 isoform X1 [Malania oleifera]
MMVSQLQGFQQDEDIRKVQRENKARVVREGKERHRQWAQKKTPRQSGGGESAIGLVDNETPQRPLGSDGMLPNDIVELLAAREKYVASRSLNEKNNRAYVCVRTCLIVFWSFISV